ncbi:MAG: 50S ribosomal protein L29 [Rickettsiales bacterium]|nr:MAG: 50S ribosomal protein L29 [Rickettsiales bacterium]
MSKTEINTGLLSGLSVEKLREKIVSLKKELFNLRFQKTLGELTDTSAFSKVRKNIARVKTELMKRKSGESK